MKQFIKENWAKVKKFFEWIFVIICIGFLVFWAIYFIPSIFNWWNDADSLFYTESSY